MIYCLCRKALLFATSKGESMAHKIPFEEIYDFYVNHYENWKKGGEEKEYLGELEKQFEIMRKISPKQFESLSAEELKKIPIAWAYDWEKVTGGFGDSSKVLEIYKKHNLENCSIKEFVSQNKKR